MPGPYSGITLVRANRPGSLLSPPPPFPSRRSAPPGTARHRLPPHSTPGSGPGRSPRELAEGVEWGGEIKKKKKKSRAAPAELLLRAGLGEELGGLCLYRPRPRPWAGGRVSDFPSTAPGQVPRRGSVIAEFLSLRDFESPWPTAGPSVAHPSVLETSVQA